MIRLEEVSQRYFVHGLVMLTVIAALLRMYGLSGMPPLADELDVARDAYDYMNQGHFGTVMWQHPKLRSILVYGGLDVFGLNVWGLRFFSLVFGVLSIPLIAWVSRIISGSFLAALLAALFMCVDTVHIDFSRQAIQEVYMPFFMLSGILLVLLYRLTNKTLLLPIAGFFFGIGMAGKWYVAFPLAVMVVVLLVDVIRTSGIRKGAGEFLFICCSLLLIPFTVYLLTYFPWFYHRGYGVDEWFATQQIMYAENLVHHGFHKEIAEIQDRNQLLWFVRPVAFVDFILAGGRPVILLGMTNPFIWLPTIPAFICILCRAFSGKKWDMLLLPCLLAASYIPFAIAQRPVWVNSSLAVAPFVFMLVSQAFVSAMKETRRWTIAFFAWLVLVIVTAFPLYLLATGKGHGTALQHIIELYRPMNERR